MVDRIGITDDESNGLVHGPNEGFAIGSHRRRPKLDRESCDHRTIPASGV